MKSSLVLPSEFVYHSPENIRAGTLLGVCTSMKPARGRQGRSAARSILTYTLNSIRMIYPTVSLLDLRDYPLPLFDGRLPQEYNEPSVQIVWSCVNQASAILLSIPAYWSGVSGVFKNFIDTLCGPSYEMKERDITVFNNKYVGLLIIGADHLSAQAGAIQAQEIMNSTGAKLVGSPVVVSNPRSSNTKHSTFSQELIIVGAELARFAYLASQRDQLKS